MTPYQLFIQRWQSGCGNTICQLASRKAFCRGYIPADILFAGEAPGQSENTLGEPFRGPAGKMLDKQIEEAKLGASGTNPWISEAKACFCNLVCCIPLDETGTKAGEPTAVEIVTCQPRLIEFIRLVKPRMIVLVGVLAKKWISGQAMFGAEWIPATEFMQFVEITHPAAILRANEAVKGLWYQRNVVTLQSAFEDFKCLR